MNVKRGQYFPNELRENWERGEECRGSKLTPMEFWDEFETWGN